jgi:hypothetical protein
MSKSKDEIKKEFNDAAVQLKDGIEKINKDYKINSQERKIKIEEKKNKERDEYAKTKKANYWSNTAWETMGSKKLKIINTLLKCFGIVFLAFGLLIFFGAGEKTGILIIAISLYFLYFDPRRFAGSSKNNKKY